MHSYTKALVVYFSRSGNTQKVAETIAQALHCDLEEIKPRPSYRGKVIGYLRAVHHALSSLKPEIAPLQKNLSQYDLILIGGPVWAGSLAPPVRTFLAQNRSSFKNIAFFLTQGTTVGRDWVFDQMKKEAERDPLDCFVISVKDIESPEFKNAVLGFSAQFQKRHPASSRSRTGEMKNQPLPPQESL